MIFSFKIKELQIRPENQKEWLMFLEQNDGRLIDLHITFRTRQRTPKQNNALYLWCTQFAKDLNDAGLDMRKVLKEAIMIRWTKDTLHDYLIIPLLTALTGKTSTTQMDKIEDINQIFDTLNVHFAEKHNFKIPDFPKEQKVEAEIDYPKENNKTAF